MTRSSRPGNAAAIGRSALVAILGVVVLGLVAKLGRAFVRKIGGDAWRRFYEEPP